ncbi:LysM peptidoglycan-binding domain-containing protein [Thalassovita taeanensis]|uniref:Murein DD-endopeptidase MepM and murein hydrolase activator NlpD, contain LysM domain n=1 Tax=Thalassovita taeanensis TaxID=657014 RepID=A0A1H9FT88_9RHOB|nr:LysM peptidoglycan-binding domain-containing protein [Thalassovita taeanensis]SEQ40713.1 Murein DD-endopeptidase MepM and murein hydrolase activator NlpD, contain LysM domain [Thalassovita taeanensis]
MTHTRRRPLARLVLAGSALALLAACDEPLDFDLRGNFGNAFNTSDAARAATGRRPRPDDRGIISYPGYQVAVARRGDTVTDVARRIGVNSAELARYNGMKADDPLRKDEVLALPGRVAEPSPATGAPVVGPIQPPSSVDIASIAGKAIDDAAPAPVETTALPPASPTSTGATPQIGIEPIRHKVARGETAYTISRLYGVTVRALAEWNGLGPDFAIREGQYLLIPVPDAQAPTRNLAAVAPVAATTVPGQGTPTPTPPSATQPLPKEVTKPAAVAAPKPAAPDLGKTQTKTASKARMAMPVQGGIIRDYAKGKNDGIDISAASGTAVKAASAGTVAAITSDADQIPIVVIKHPDNLLTVYANVDGITVKKGDTVARGQSIAKIREGKSNYVHFEVRNGFDSVDPTPYLQ